MDVFLSDLWTFATGLAVLGAATWALGHLLLHKRDSRSATAWAGLILLVPALGAALYYLFGVNRVGRRAGRLEGLRAGREIPPADPERGIEAVRAELPSSHHHLERIAARVDGLGAQPLTPGNRITPLDGGDAAYPEMLAAIDRAQRTLALSSYIFRSDETGEEFAAALARAHARGVAVRVLVDGVGGWHGLLQGYLDIARRLRRAEVPVARFLYNLVPWRMPYLNMRNHAKLLIADGRVGFTGGMNILDSCRLSRAGDRGIADVQFRVEGPVVAQMMRHFAADWQFTTGEVLEGAGWFPKLRRAGDSLGRGIESGPDYDENPLRWTLLSAIGAARERVRVVTPYFLPDETVLAALRLAAAGGITVDIVIPATIDYRLMQWAARVEQEVAVAAGCRVHLAPPPFDHAKLMTVDGGWALVGSGNWDMRSLRLNFEYVMEWYDPAFAAQVDALIDARIARARVLTAEEIAARPLADRLRDGAAHLLHPYL